MKPKSEAKWTRGTYSEPILARRERCGRPQRSTSPRTGSMLPITATRSATRPPRDRGALVHLGDAHQVTIVDVATLQHRHREVVALVAAIGRQLAQVPLDAARAQARPGEVHPQRVLGADHADADRPLTEDLVAG